MPEQRDLQVTYLPKELAVALRKSVPTIRRWIRLDLIRHIHVGGSPRIPSEEYERVLRDGIRIRR